MGIRAGYVLIDRAASDRIEADNTQLYVVLQEVNADSERSEEPAADIDKLWDGLHFFLTGRNSESEEAEAQDDPLSAAVLGAQVLDADDHVGLITSARVPQIAAAMRGFALEERLAAADFAAFDAAGLYPHGWDEDPEILRSELRTAFLSLLGLYNAAEANGMSVLVTID